MTTDILLVISGLVGLVLGGELLVRGAVGVAQRLGLSQMVIGVTLVGFGTSAPELAASLSAALSGSPGIALGNVVGSNIGNILLILGAAALLRPVVLPAVGLGRDGGVMLASALALAAVVLVGADMGRLVGAGFVIWLAAYLTVTLRSGSGPVTEVEAVPAAPGAVWSGLGLAGIGLVALVGGANLLVTGASGIARAAGLSDAVIGLTVVAIGTSLPELVTALVAARKGHGDVALGNVLGSNIFNILGILGVTALVQPMQVPQQIAGFDIWVMLAVTIFLLAFARAAGGIGRAGGAIMVALYAGYLGWLFVLS
ncbi:calcium/sodium antiporter [Roseovarius sp. SCSIO 43702]|uniref:calcium/sodium antiporter n=1 Tax=Roseovarius sp. SCSIO 43702 TaxID=2823043 RepID=UPI001C73C8BA|nr:calcium/sodium antiporter [Roseovarius sp. SCSIO 43702]QYX55487.1 calcium/sodium antiporter [Roseovarius sp. SCSIO 43702]